MIDEPEPDTPLDERDEPQEADVSHDDEPELAHCPHCGKTIYEETVKCPHCGDWIIDRPSNETKRSKWFWPIVVAIGVAMILVSLVARAL